MNNLYEILNLVKKMEIFDREQIKKELSELNYNDYYGGSAVVRILVKDDTDFMVPQFLRDIGIPVDNSVANQACFGSWRDCSLLPILRDKINIEGVFVDFNEGGLCINHYKGE